MTTFNYEWDATFEANPEDTDYFHFGALEIRDLKKAFRERFNVDHYMPLDGGEDQGEHRKLTIRVNDEYAPAEGEISNIKISAVDGNAFLDFGDILAGYIDYRIILIDSTGKKLIGYIKAAGTGETLSDELTHVGG